MAGSIAFLPRKSEWNGSEGVVYGGENFGPVVVALKDAAYRTTIAGAKISDHSSALNRATH